MQFVLSLAFSDPAQLCPLAQAAEAAGFAGVALSDHVVHPEHIASRYPYTADGSPRWQAFTPWPDPMVTLGALAAVTRHLRLLTSVFVLPLRHPVHVAKAVGTAAVLSGERVTLGVGAGWMREEFEVLDQPFAGRGRRMDEMIQILRALWSGGMVEHHGSFYRFERLEMSPAPRAPVPIYVGGLSKPALRRAAHLGDGWISDLHSTDELRAIVATLGAYRADGERAGQPLDVVAALTDAVDRDGYRRAADAGATHLMTLPWLFYGGPTEDLERRRDGIRRFGEEIIEPLRGSGHVAAQTSS